MRFNPAVELVSAYIASNNSGRGSSAAAVLVLAVVDTAVPAVLSAVGVGVFIHNA